jgi:outer membrane lipoprotein carrier protein
MAVEGASIGGSVLKKAAIFVLMTLATPAFGSGEVEQVIKGVEAAYRDVQTLRADFVQVTRSSAMGDETKQKGRVQLKRPKMMRWVFTQPQGKLFVTNGETMWVWSQEENQVIVSKGVGASSGGMGQLLDDLNRLGDLFDVVILPEQVKAGSIVLGLTPKQETSFQSLKLQLDQKTYVVQQVVMVDAFANEVELSFSQVKFNVEMTASEFMFDVPAGAQVLNADGP